MLQLEKVQHPFSKFSELFFNLWYIRFSYILIPCFLQANSLYTSKVIVSKVKPSQIQTAHAVTFFACFNRPWILDPHIRIVNVQFKPYYKLARFYLIQSHLIILHLMIKFFDLSNCFVINGLLNFNVPLSNLCRGLRISK